MPCPPRGNRIHHLHIGKTGGRSVIAELPRTLGIPLCDWPEWPDWSKELYTNVSGFNKVAAIRGVANEACITSYESTWATVGAFKEPPFVVTFLREPMSWAASAIMHYYEGGWNDGPDEVIDLQRAEGCFPPPKADHLLPNQSDELFESNPHLLRELQKPAAYLPAPKFRYWSAGPWCP